MVMQRLEAVQMAHAQFEARQNGPALLQMGVQRVSCALAQGRLMACTWLLHQGADMN